VISKISDYRTPRSASQVRDLFPFGDSAASRLGLWVDVKGRSSTAPPDTGLRRGGATRLANSEWLDEWKWLVTICFTNPTDSLQSRIRRFDSDPRLQFISCTNRIQR